MTEAAGPREAAVKTLIAAELVDGFHIWIFPVVLGTGKRLFEDGVPPRGLDLEESRSTPAGVLLNSYRLAGLLPRSTVQPESPSAAELERRKKLAAEAD